MNQKQENILSINLGDLLQEYPDQVELIIQVCQKMIYEPKLLDSEDLVKIYNKSGHLPEVLDTMLGIKINEGW